MSNQFLEQQGRLCLYQLNMSRNYDAWINNAISSTDGRNSRKCVNISKKIYLQQYWSIENKDILFEENVNKPLKEMLSVTRMVAIYHKCYLIKTFTSRLEVFCRENYPNSTIFL